MSTTQALKLDDETNERLKTLAQKRDRSAHWLMREALQRYLTEEERYEREKAEDLAEYENYMLTGKAVDNETVTSWLNELASGKKTAWPKQK
ncbi:MAG TPA: ribbon-helix-helix protein, CopG family [Candidatus Saccharimonadales bacterium]|nr:ribbon-helix-helix protein, CopG family [Candidatus Saccharimonadales bacterium]